MITAQMTIGEVVAKYPDIVPILTKHGLPCVGCHVSPFETIENSGKVLDIPEQNIAKMVAEVNEFIAANPERAVVKKENAALLELSPKAADKLKALMAGEGKADHGLRIAVVAGGCSGFSYEMEFEKEAGPGDESIESGGLKVFIAREHADAIRGTEIDYVESLRQTGFVMKNPNAKSRCGCGSSFGV